MQVQSLVGELKISHPTCPTAGPKKWKKKKNFFFLNSFVICCCCSVFSDCDPLDCSMPGFPVLHHLPEIAQTCPLMPSYHPILCCTLLLPSIFCSLMAFSNESALHIRWPKYWSFSISPSNKYSGLISFRIDWLDLLAVQGTLKSLLQHQNSKASILQCSVFFMVQFSHPYMTTGKKKKT